VSAPTVDKWRKRKIDSRTRGCTLRLTRGEFAEATRTYLEARDALPEEPLACAVPVSVKSEEELRHFSNKVSIMNVRLPTHLDDPAAIVRAVQQETEAAKRSFEASDPELVLGWLDWAPGPLVTIGARLFTGLELANRVPMPWNCVVSNMRGAPFPLYFAGAKVLATYPMGPAGDAGDGWG
jgi:diacylglycerol O-acyltransferase